MNKSQAKKLIQNTLKNNGIKAALKDIAITNYCSNDGYTLQSALFNVKDNQYELVYSTIISR